MGNETVSFEGPIVWETAYGVIDKIPKAKSTMTLMNIESHYVIEWVVGDPKDPIEVVEIGVWTKDKKVVDYDGVFELPKEALKLLKDNGFDTSEVEVNDKD